MTGTTKRLNNLSGISFFIGFMTSKLQFLPFPAVAAACRFISLGFYFVAYGAWLGASYNDDSFKNFSKRWYGFAKPNMQNVISSAIGLVATALSLAAIFIPALFPPAAWLFALGSAIWAISEYHKSKKPPVDPTYSQTKQDAISSYASTNMTISVVTALAATLIFAFPPLAIPITIFSLMVCGGLGILAGEFWLNANFADHKPVGPVAESTKGMVDGLGIQMQPIPKEILDSEPTHFKSPIATQDPQARPPASSSIMDAPGDAPAI